MPYHAGNQLGRHYTRFFTLDARNRAVHYPHDRTLQRGKPVLSPRNNASEISLQHRNCGSWANGTVKNGLVIYQ